MSILKPSPGELNDRMTILVLKIEAGRKQGKDCKPWILELDAIHKVLLILNRETEEIKATRTVLAGINKVIWDCEDKMRSFPDEESDAGTFHEVALDIARTAKNIAFFNDQRMAKVRELNVMYGDEVEATASEKLYEKK